MGWFEHRLRGKGIDRSSLNGSPFYEVEHVVIRDERPDILNTCCGEHLPVIELVPPEGMVERRAGFDAMTDDWEPRAA